MTETEWSKREKEIARRLSSAACFHEGMAAREIARKMAAGMMVFEIIIFSA